MEEKLNTFKWAEKTVTGFLVLFQGQSLNPADNPPTPMCGKQGERRAKKECSLQS